MTYFDEIAKSAICLGFKPASNLINSDNVENAKTSSSERLRKFSTVVEEVETTRKTYFGFIFNSKTIHQSNRTCNGLYCKKYGF
jgi:hypothetical protein